MDGLIYLHQSIKASNQIISTVMTDCKEGCKVKKNGSAFLEWGVVCLEVYW